MLQCGCKLYHPQPPIFLDNVGGSSYLERGSTTDKDKGFAHKDPSSRARRDGLNHPEKPSESGGKKAYAVISWLKKMRTKK